jgi:hypothetical protein
MRSALPLILVSAYLFGCESEVLPPERPDGVPESAVWGGGVDGGSWLDCMPTERAHSFACSVFWDSDGALRSSDRKRRTQASEESYRRADVRSQAQLGM